MIKKFLILFNLLFLIFGMVNFLNVSAKEDSYLNKNGVEIFTSDYEIFNALMYEQKDIDALTQEQVQKLREINITSAFSQIKYIKTGYKFLDSDIEERFEIYLTESEFNKEVQQKKAQLEKNNQTRALDTEQAYYTFDYLILHINGVFDSSASSNGRFTIRVTATWSTNPEFTTPDIVSILYDNNHIILSEVLQVDSLGQRYMPDFYTVSWHNLLKYENHNVTSDEEIITATYLGQNLDYTHDDETGLAVVYELPISRPPKYEGPEDTDGFGYLATNLRFALEANFDVLYPNLGAMGFTAQYIYNTPNIEMDFNFSNISFVTVNDKKILNIFNILTFEMYSEVYEVDLYFSNLPEDDDDDIGGC